MKLIHKIKYFFSKFSFLKTYFSPFKPLKIKLYIGKLAIGTPIFFPRRWKKYTPKTATERALEDHTNYMKEWSFRERYDYYIKCRHAVPKRIGFDFVGLGWKTKWEDTDYRFEWSPVWSFVFFRWQIALTFVAPKIDHYWECWLYYSRNTDKSKTTKERIVEAKEGFPCIWTNHSKDGEKEICYWDLILKKRFL